MSRLVDYISLLGNRFPYIKKTEIIPGNIKKALNQFSKWKYDKVVLFHMYCDLIGVTEKGATLWRDIKFKKDIPVYQGVSVDETLMEEYVWTIRNAPADQLISQLFYSGTENRSAFELGLIVPVILGMDSEDTYVYNPSPYVIQETIGKNKGYIVWDDYFKRAYSKEYQKDRFIDYDHVEELEQGKRVVASIFDVKDCQILWKIMREKNPQELVLSIPQSLFIKLRPEWIKILSDCGLNMQGLLLVDTAVMPASPKKHMVLFCDKKAADYPFVARVLSLSENEMVIGDEEYFIDEAYFQYGKMTIRDVCSLNKTEKEKKHRNRPEEYYFSKEIRIQYKRRNYEERKVAIASYSSLPDETGKTKRLSGNVEKGLEYTSENDLKKKLEKAVFLEKLRKPIVDDIKGHFNEKYEYLSLKTLWYLFRDDLQMQAKYDDEVCMKMFVNERNDLQNLNYLDLLTGGKSGAVETFLADKEAEGKEYVKQLDLLFSKLIKDKVFRVNPFKEIAADYSNRMSEEQYEVRNALVKKNLSIKQQRQLLVGSCQRNDWQESEDFKTLVIAFRLFTGIPVREMLALKWADVIENKDYQFYQIKVTMMIDKAGEKTVYGLQDDWKRFRLIPVVPALSRLLFRRKKRWMKQYGLTEEKMDSIPIFCERYDRRKKEQQLMRYEKINQICRQGIEKLNIPKLEVLLPGDKDLLTDLNRYYSDLFLSNFRYYTKRKCCMTQGETNYLLGINQVDTYAEHYCDYTNDAVQYQMLRKLTRWSALLHREDKEETSATVKCVECHIHTEKESDLEIGIKNEFGGTVKVRVMKQDRQYEE